jgi:hypothetical protein
MCGIIIFIGPFTIKIYVFFHIIDNLLPKPGQLF